MSASNKLPMFFRKNHIIRTVERDDQGRITSYTDEHFKDPMNPKWPSINAAKRKSRELQAANGGLGMGSLKVVEKLPETVL